MNRKKERRHDKEQSILFNDPSITIINPFRMVWYNLTLLICVWLLFAVNGIEGKEENLTQYVNAFIGTQKNANPGNVFPGAAIPFGMAKVGIDVDVFAPSGYISNLDNNKVTGMSLLHDSGTGAGGSYGTYASMPVYCKNDEITNCKPAKVQRKRPRKKDGNKSMDEARPGYFSSILNDDTRLEATTTRRSALLRYTFNSTSTKPIISFDWTEDLSNSFRGKGHVQIIKDAQGKAQQILLNGTFGSSFAEEKFHNNQFACFDLNDDKEQIVDQSAIWRVGSKNKTTIDTQKSSADATEFSDDQAQYGVLISWENTSKANNKTQILLRVGISFLSAEQACQNAKEEIPSFDFDLIAQKSNTLWQEKLSRIELDPSTDPTIQKLFYSSLYRGFLTPSNSTYEAQGEFIGTKEPYFDSLYCTWDTFRTFFPLLSLTSAHDYADITRSYVDGWRKAGFIPECRANNEPGYTQGGSDGTNVLADFAVKYRNAKLGVNFDDLYSALKHDATYDSKTFNWAGRQIAVYEKYGYIPSDYYDKEVQGLQLFQSSRTAEYVYNDFGIRNVALLMGKMEDAARWSKRALFYRNLFDKDVNSFGFSNFMQKRLMNGSFDRENPIFCSPADTNTSHNCFYDSHNTFGFYESSSWEYSFFVPHDFAGLISLISNNSFSAFIKRIDTFFERNLFRSDDEPSFQTPVTYHYANSPTRSVARVQKLVLNEFNLTTGGIPGNDDGGAMATLLVMHLMGLYPVPSTREYLILSPFIPSYTIYNSLLGNVTITAQNFDPSFLRGGTQTLQNTTRAYVKSVTINGKQQSSRCKITFDDFFPLAASNKTDSVPQHTQIIFLMATREEVTDCGPNTNDLPSSMSTGGFATF